ncbi:MAG: glycyl radical enzyme domain-containing protein [Oscillospiraceae bacterium]
MDYTDNREALSLFDLEAFMKSITYAPVGMTLGLAREQIEAEGEYICAADRERRILRRAFEILPIGINHEDLIAGNYGEKFADPDYVRAAEDANEREYARSEEFKVYEDERIISGRYMLFGIYTPSHVCMDYENILRQGLKAYARRAKEAMPSSDGYGRDYLQAMADSVDTIQMLAGRFAALAEEQLHNEADDTRRGELSRMIAALRRVPYEPAQDLYEALQSMWLVHTAIPASDRSWASVSLGRMDQYLLPYYKKWLTDGYTREEAKRLLCQFFLLLDSYGDGSGALNLGSSWNELTDLLLEVEKTVRYRAPIIAVRLSEDSTDDVYGKVVDRTLFKIGQPTFYGEANVKKAMDYRGMSHEDDFSINSCMGSVVVGKELADMWGCCLNMNLPLELAVNCGEPLRGRLPEMLRQYIDVTPEEPRDMNVIRRKYGEYMRCCVRYVASQNMRRAAWVALNRPNPLLSLLLDDCVSFGRDRAQSAVHFLGERAEALLPRKDRERYNFGQVRQGRGVKYHNVTMLAMGYAHAADALTAIDKLVFEEKRYTLAQLIAAAADNYSASEEEADILAALRRCDKYGEGKIAADRNAAFVLDALADACEEQYTGPIRYLPSCHTIDANIQFGSCVYASLDGRMDGEGFAKNAGATITAIKSDPTGLMISAGRLPQKRFSGGVPIDIYVPDSIFESQENTDKFKALLRAYVSGGGMQVQVNSVDLELLKKAYAKPEEYPHVIVRKGGFSLYFTDMLRCVQKDMIERFEMEQK